MKYLNEINENKKLMTFYCHINQLVYKLHFFILFINIDKY